MHAYTIDISSWTASFRYPNLISGFQPTLEVPPISTVLGLINAAAGSYLKHEVLRLGYYFEFDLKDVDLETIYQVEGNKDKGQPTNKVNSNVVRREFLYGNRLRLYVEDPEIAAYFRQPVFPMLLGRMNDLATVEQVSKDPVPLRQMAEAQRIRGQVVPFFNNRLPGVLQALPKYFTDELPRRNLGTEPYSVIGWRSGDFPSRLTTFRDETAGEQGIDVYFHELDFRAYFA